jgi:hypothetical protein
MKKSLKKKKYSPRQSNQRFIMLINNMNTKKCWEKVLRA